MDHLYGSWGWFDCAGLGSSFAGSVLFKALAGHPHRLSTETGLWRCVNTGTRRSHITGAEAGTIGVVARALTPLVNASKAPRDRPGAPNWRQAVTAPCGRTGRPRIVGLRLIDQTPRRLNRRRCRPIASGIGCSASGKIGAVTSIDWPKLGIQSDCLRVLTE
jgi:hypothetical protein